MRIPLLQRSSIWLLILAALTQIAQSIQLTDTQAQSVGRRLWQNESGGSIAGLTAWNVGEDFASLGIGHFIWYPKRNVDRLRKAFPHCWLFYDPQEYRFQAG